MNEDQIRVIKSMDNILLIAGAGSGKTTTIINKVAYLIDNNLYKENEILIISFTNKSVEDIKDRLKYIVDVKTFHKLALDIINDNSISISNTYLLDYVINEYINSYAKYDKQAKSRYSKILLEKNTNLPLLIKTFINIYKSNYENIDYLYELYKKSIFTNKYYYKIILDIYLIYQRELESTISFDFNDLISKATTIININQYTSYYKYIIVDEFQDTSLMRLNLIISMFKQNNAKLLFVGDDYQSIYRFSGCDLSIFLNIKKYIPNIKIYYLRYNYRNSQELILVANSFILRNKLQIKKNNVCFKNCNQPIKIVFYVNNDKVINKLMNYLGEINIVILGRNNNDKKSFKCPDSIPYYTIHKSKGLEFDNVVIINLTNCINGFPSKIKNSKLLNKILPTDYVLYEEERRIFYVALTRSKNYVYLVAPKNNYSIFIKEIIIYYKNYIEFINI